MDMIEDSSSNVAEMNTKLEELNSDSDSRVAVGYYWKPLIYAVVLNRIEFVRELWTNYHQAPDTSPNVESAIQGILDTCVLERAFVDKVEVKHLIELSIKTKNLDMFQFLIISAEDLKAYKVGSCKRRDQLYQAVVEGGFLSKDHRFTRAIIDLTGRGIALLQYSLEEKDVYPSRPYYVAPAFFQGVERNRIENVKYILEKAYCHPDIGHKTTPQVKTALAAAASDGNEDMCKLLTQHGADISLSSKGFQPWLWALSAGHLDLLPLLLDPLPDKDKAIQDGFLLASGLDKLTSVKYMLENNIIPHERINLAFMEHAIANDAHVTATYLIPFCDFSKPFGSVQPEAIVHQIMNRHYKGSDAMRILKSLKRGDVDFNSIHDDLTPLMLAVSSYKYDVLLCLLELGADPNIITDKGKYLLLEMLKAPSSWLSKSVNVTKVLSKMSIKVTEQVDIFEEISLDRYHVVAQKLIGVLLDWGVSIHGARKWLLNQSEDKLRDMMQNHGQFLKYIESRTQCPLTLLDSCKHCIRRELLSCQCDVPLKDKLKTLPLPEVIKKFIELGYLDDVNLLENAGRRKLSARHKVHHS